MNKITPEMLVKDILAGLETDSGIILGIEPKHKAIIEILMLKAIEGWERLKLMEESNSKP